MPLYLFKVQASGFSLFWSQLHIPLPSGDLAGGNLTLVTDQDELGWGTSFAVNTTLFLFVILCYSGAVFIQVWLCDIVIYNKKYVFHLHSCFWQSLKPLDFLNDGSDKGVLILVTNPFQPHPSLC